MSQAIINIHISQMSVVIWCLIDLRMHPLFCSKFFNTILCDQQDQLRSPSNNFLEKKKKLNLRLTVSDHVDCSAYPNKSLCMSTYLKYDDDIGNLYYFPIKHTHKHIYKYIILSSL